VVDLEEMTMGAARRDDRRHCFQWAVSQAGLEKNKGTPTLCHIMSHYVNPILFWLPALTLNLHCGSSAIIASVPSISFSIFAMPLAVIPNGPYSIVPLVWTLGLLTAAVMVDSVALADAEHTQSMLSGFYRVKAVDPPVWFLAINLALLLLGLLGNVSSLIAVFTAQCTIKRRFLELVGVLLFVGNVWFNVAVLGPLEASVATLPRTVSSELGTLL
jgi:hypothetical protein